MWMRIFEEKVKHCEAETAANLFFQSACRVSDKTALEWYDFGKECVIGVTYEELFADVIALGTEIYAKGLRGKTVALIGDRSYEWVLMFLTLICSNVVVLPLDPNLDKKDIEERITFSDVQICFADDKLPVFDADVNMPQTELHRLSEVMPMCAEGRIKLEHGNHEWIEDEILEKQRFLMLYTSGTGGVMKVAMIKQENFTLERFVWNELRLYESKCLITLPLYHIAGIADLRGALFVGTTAYLSSGLKYLLKEYAYVKPRAGFMVPAQALLLSEVLSGKEKKIARELLGNNLSAIRVTGAPLPQNIRDKFKEYDIRVTSDYGMTETAGPVSVSITRDGEFFSKEGSVGHILDCLDVTVDNPDENGCGEILVSGQCVFDGYYKNQEETDSMIVDGRLHTGDVGYIDEDRFLFIVGRKKNVIILASGENVIPEEIEKQIYRIAEVEECLVYEKGDVIAARIFCQDATKHEIIKEEIDKLNKKLPTYKRIGVVEMQTEPLPKTMSGKIRRA